MSEPHWDFIKKDGVSLQINIRKYGDHNFYCIEWRDEFGNHEVDAMTIDECLGQIASLLFRKKTLFQEEGTGVSRSVDRVMKAIENLKSLKRITNQKGDNVSIETLKNLKEIGGYPVNQDNEIADGKWSDVDKKYSVCVHHGDNTIAFRIQNGPVKEVGVNGCQVDTIIHAAKHILEGLDKKIPCDENKEAIDYLGEALECLNKRTRDREARGVESTLQA